MAERVQHLPLALTVGQKPCEQSSSRHAHLLENWPHVAASNSVMEIRGIKVEIETGSNVQLTLLNIKIGQSTLICPV